MAFLDAPKVTKRELENHLSKHFNLGKLLSYKKIKKGLANCLYHIKTTKGDFIFKIVIRTSPNHLQYEIDLLNFINNLPIPKPIKTKSGKYLFDYKNRKTFVYRFIVGKEEKNFSMPMVYEVGEFLGKLHLQTKKFTSLIKRIDFYDTSKQTLDSILGDSSHFKSAKIQKAISYLKDNVSKYKLSPQLPKGAMHIDLKPENTIFYKGKIAGVVDFDCSYTGPLIFDLACTIMWFCSRKGKFDIKNAKELYRGYTGSRKLSRVEKDWFWDSLHNIYLAITLRCIDYVTKKKMPESFLIWVIDNLLETEKNLKLTRNQFKEIFY